MFDQPITFLVRFKPDGEEKGEIIGVIIAWSWDEAFQLVDEYTNPWDCELFPLGDDEHGIGIFFNDGFPSDDLVDPVADDTAWNQAFLEMKRNAIQLERLRWLEREATDVRQFIKAMEGAVRCRSTTPPTSEKK